MTTCSILITVVGSTTSTNDKMWEHSSAGRASALQAEGHRFEPCCSHHMARWYSWLARRPVTAEVEGSSPFRVAMYAFVAQSVEQWTENPCVVGSIPTESTTYAGLAHLVERHLAKVEVASSSLVTRSRKTKKALLIVLFSIIGDIAKR